MKNTIIIFSIILASCCTTKVQSQPVIISTNDTLQWLKTNIEQRSNYFMYKPLSVLLDSLYNIRSGIIEYDRNYKSDNAPAHTLPGDTVWTSRIKLYFGEIYGGGKSSNA